MTSKIQTLTLTFTDRDTYVAWRKQWKADYALLTQLIRDFKFCRKTKLTEDQQARYDKIAATHKGQYGFSPYGWLIVYPTQATEYMELLKAAKLMAQEQYLAAQAAKAVTP